MMISSYHNKESMIMNSSPLLTPLPPSQIECSLSCRIANDANAPQSPLPSFIVDYGMFRAEEEKERDERHLLVLLREQQQKLKQQQSRRDSYTRAIVVPCGNHDDNSSEGSSSSEVMFALKVSKPSRLVPRRSKNLSSSRSSIRGLRGWGNQSMMTDNKQSNQRTFNGMMMTSDMSLMSLLEESMIFHQSPAQEDKEEKEEEEPMQDNDDLLLDQLLGDDLPAPPMGDFSQTNHNLSNSSNMNHDSFQSTEEEGEQPTHLLGVDPLLQRRNKKRRIMMNWLANQEASRNLLVAAGSSSSTSDSPFVPPTFVKVIYCNNNNEDASANISKQSWNSNNADPTTTSTIIGLDQSHHNNVASPMA